MSRERMTSREVDAAKILKAVESLEIAAKENDDAALVKEADAIAKEDKTTVNESAPVGKVEVKDQGDQNAKANANWPVSEADKVKVARKLVTLARELLEV